MPSSSVVRRALALLPLLALTSAPRSARAEEVLILDTWNGTVFVSDRPAGNSLGALITIGVPVTISNIAVRNDLDSSGHFKFLVLSHPDHELVYVRRAPVLRGRWHELEEVAPPRCGARGRHLRHRRDRRRRRALDVRHLRRSIRRLLVDQVEPQPQQLCFTGLRWDPRRCRRSGSPVRAPPGVRRRHRGCA